MSRSILRKYRLPGQSYLSYLSDLRNSSTQDYVDLLCCVVDLQRDSDGGYFTLCDGSAEIRLNFKYEWVPLRVYWLKAVQRGWFLRLRNISRDKADGGEVQLLFRNNSHLIRVPDCALSVVSHIKPNLQAALTERLRIVAAAVRNRNPLSSKTYFSNTMKPQAQSDQFMVLNSQELEKELADDDDDDDDDDERDIETKEQDMSVTDEDTGFDICLKHPLHQGTVVMYVVFTLQHSCEFEHKIQHTRTQVQSCTSLQA